MWLLRDLPVCIPNAAPIPKMTMKMTKGTRLGCNPLLRLSEMANTTKTRMKVPMNWSGRWERISSKPRSGLEKSEAGSHFIKKAIG